MISKDDKLLARLQAQCVRREYCARDMYQKALRGLGGDEEGAAQMVSLLVADRYVDDLRYSTAFARDKAVLNGWGAVKISSQLMARGVARDVIRQALSEIDADKADARLISVLEAKYRTLKGDPEVRLKMLRYALTRGYDYDKAAAAVKSVMSAGED